MIVIPVRAMVWQNLVASNKLGVIQSRDCLDLEALYIFLLNVMVTPGAWPSWTSFNGIGWLDSLSSSPHTVHMLTNVSRQPSDAVMPLPCPARNEDSEERSVIVSIIC